MSAEQRVQRLQLEYVTAIDEDNLEAWPDFFTENCRYRITHSADYQAGLPIGLIYADSKGMLRDRVSSVREVNVFEPQRYRHITSPPLIIGEMGNRVEAKTSFSLYRIVQGGPVVLFATGIYLDKIVLAEAGGRFEEKLVVLDSQHIDTLLALPI